MVLESAQETSVRVFETLAKRAELLVGTQGGQQAMGQDSKSRDELVIFLQKLVDLGLI